MMYNIELIAKHQELTVRTMPLAGQTRGYLTAKIDCTTDDWAGRTVWACFSQLPCEPYRLLVKDGEITAAQKLNLSAGDWGISLYGIGADGSRITTNEVHICVAPTGMLDGEPFPDIPPSVGEQLQAEIGSLDELKTTAKQDLVSAINEVRQTGGGGMAYTIGHGLKLDAKTNTLSVDTADKMEQDNTLPITSAAVYVEVGNINALLKTI